MCNVRMQQVKATHLLEDLRDVLETMDDKVNVMQHMPKETQTFFKQWLSQSLGTKVRINLIVIPWTILSV